MSRYLVCSYTKDRLAPGFEWYENRHYACQLYRTGQPTYAYTVERNRADLLDKRGVDELISQSNSYWLRKMTITEG